MGNNIELIIKALGFSPELLQNQIPAITSLLNDLNENIITSDDVSEQLEQKPKKPCMRSIYPEWIDFKSKETSYANACNLQSRWKRYFEHSRNVISTRQKISQNMPKNLQKYSILKQ